MKAITLSKISVRHQSRGQEKALDESFDAGLEYALKDFAVARIHQLEENGQNKENQKVEQQWEQFDQWKKQMIDSFGSSVFQFLCELESIIGGISTERGDQQFTTGLIEGYKLAKMANGGF